MRWDPHLPPRTLVWRCLLIICAVSLLAWAPDPPKQPEHPPELKLPDFSTLIQGQVTRVLDENTVLIRVNGRTVRYDLLGVATIPTRDKQNAALAVDALSRMALGESVFIEHDPQGERNAGNRFAGHLYRTPDHLPINLELVRQGYTRHSPAGMSIHHEVFVAYQSRAQSLERGIWDTDRPTLPLPEIEPEPEPEPTSPRPTKTTRSNGNTIYITAYGTRYHRKDYPHLTDSARPATRQEVKDSHKPCKTCKPDDEAKSSG